jgi:hypothetical protein
MIGDPLQPFDSFIISKLEGDTALAALLGGAGRIWQGLAPQGIGEPVVTYDFVSAQVQDVIGEGVQGRASVWPLYLVLAQTQANSYAQSSTIADRIDRILTGASGSVPNANLYISSVKQEGGPIRYFQVVNGVRFNFQGARYRAFLSSIS